MKKYFVSALILLLLVIVGFAMFKALKENEESSKIPIIAEYNEKIVYTTDLSTDSEKLSFDCSERKGVFNECGSICPVEEQVCATVCAYTCEFGSEHSEPIIDEVSYTNASPDWITVLSPLPGDIISSPLVITGTARGNWFFEASAPISLVDWDGRIIAQKYIMTIDDWMTTDHVTFEGSVDFTLEPENAVYRRGTLIIHNDNPSGLPEHDRAIEIPVRF